MPLSQDRVRSCLEYDPDSGSLRWSVHKGTKKPGDEAGVVSGGYRLVRLDGRLYKAHALIWLLVTGALPEGDIDHIDGDGLNNRWSNLRVLSHRENMRNVVQARSHNGTGVLGVTLHKPSGKWRARITCDGVEKYLGLYPTVEAASAAYWEAKASIHGLDLYQVRLQTNSLSREELLSCHS